MKAVNELNFKIEKIMNKATKIYLIQFACFAAVFLISRYVISYFNLFSGLWIPIVSGLIAIVLAPQFKIFKIDGKDTVFMAWILSKKGTPIKWL